MSTAPDAARTPRLSLNLRDNDPAIAVDRARSGAGPLEHERGGAAACSVPQEDGGRDSRRTRAGEAPCDRAGAPLTVVLDRIPGAHAASRGALPRPGLPVDPRDAVLAMHERLVAGGLAPRDAMAVSSRGHDAAGATANEVACRGA